MPGAQVDVLDTCFPAESSTPVEGGRKVEGSPEHEGETNFFHQSLSIVDLLAKFTPTKSWKEDYVFRYPWLL